MYADHPRNCSFLHAVQQYRIELDGIRGLAALLVVLEHTWWRFGGAGATGVWLFFALSGYLLSQPFVSKPERAVDARYVSQYLMRRLTRIIPLYYLALFLYYGVTGRAQLLFNHMLFIQAEGHLWTIPQEIIFYLGLPFLMLAAWFICKHSRALFLLVLSVTTLVLLYQPHRIGIELYGLGYNRHPYVAWFLIGVLVAYLKPESYAQMLSDKPKLKQGISAFGIVLLLALLVASTTSITQYLTGYKNALPAVFSQGFAIALSGLIFLVLITPNTALSKVFSNFVLRSIGIIGYSYYLLSYA